MRRFETIIFLLLYVVVLIRSCLFVVVAIVVLVVVIYDNGYVLVDAFWHKKTVEDPLSMSF